MDDGVVGRLRRRLMVCGWQSLSTTLPLLLGLRWPLLGGRLVTMGPFGRVRPSVFCHHGSTTLLDCRPGGPSAGRAGGAQSASGSHRGAHHVAHRLAGRRGPRTRVARPRLLGSSGSRRAGGLARCACMATWCSCSRTGRPAGPRGTRLWAWRCGRRCGTSLTASGGRTWTRNPQVLGSGALVPIPCGTVLPGGFDEAGRWRWQLAHMLLVAMAYSRRS